MIESINELQKTILVVNYLNMIDNFKDYFDKTADNCKTVIITRKNGKKLLWFSFEEHNNMKNHLYYE